VFADRPEAVSYLPRPPDLAFAFAIIAIAWGCLWRGMLRWAAVLFLIAGAAIYATTPRPMLLMDGEGEAIIARVAGDAAPIWTSLPRSGATFERERLGQLAGLGPRQVATLAEPEQCAPDLCAWRTPKGRVVFLVRTDGGWAQACARNAIVIGQTARPLQWERSCAVAALITRADLGRRGGASITEQGATVRIRYARTAVPRTWTPAMTAAQ
jgi:hypothetical protein